MKQPVIKYEIFSKRVRIAIIATSMLINMIIGFVIGVIAVRPDIDSVVELPKAMDSYRADPRTRMPNNEDTRWEYSSLSKEAKCLADNIYHEGRGQHLQGQIAIGLATINRVKSKHYPDSICEVVWEKRRDRKTKKWVAMFSWTLDGKSDKIHNKDAYEEITLLAEAMIAEGTLDNFDDFTDGATHYHNDSVNPYWASSMDKIAKIDDHTFYKN